jgi:hypothetical protein
VKIGLAVVLVKAVVDEHSLGGCFQVVGYMSAEVDSLGGFQVAGYMSAEVDSLGGFQVVGYMSAEVDSLGERGGIQVVGCVLVEVDSLAGTVVQQSRLELGHRMVKNYALDADAEEPGPFLEDLDCISMNVRMPQNLAERPRFVVAGMRVNED